MWTHTSQVTYAPLEDFSRNPSFHCLYLEKLGLPTVEMMRWSKNKGYFEHTDTRLDHEINVARSRDADVQAMRLGRTLDVHKRMEESAGVCRVLKNRVHTYAMQCTATHRSTLQHAAAHCNTLLHTATDCNTLQHAAAHCTALQRTVTHCNTLQHTATHCNTLQHTATHCNTL